jgi:hypothetical protein
MGGGRKKRAKRARSSSGSSSDSSDSEIEIGITVKGRIMGVAEYGAFMNAAGQVAVNSAPYVAGHCFFNALENALRYRQSTKVLQLGTGGDSDWRKRYRRTMRLRGKHDGGSYDINSAFHLEHKPLSNSGARLVDWSRRYDVLELSKVRRQVAVVQRAAAFLDAIIRTWRTPAVYSQVREKERGREEEEEKERRRKEKKGEKGKEGRGRKSLVFFLVWEQSGLAQS